MVLAFEHFWHFAMNKKKPQKKWCCSRRRTACFKRRTALLRSNRRRAVLLLKQAEGLSLFFWRTAQKRTAPFLWAVLQLAVLQKRTIWVLRFLKQAEWFVSSRNKKNHNRRKEHLKKKKNKKNHKRRTAQKRTAPFLFFSWNKTRIVFLLFLETKPC